MIHFIRKGFMSPRIHVHGMSADCVILLATAPVGLCVFFYFYFQVYDSHMGWLRLVGSLKS